MEFVVVEYPLKRRVRIDSALFGFTQAVLQCRAGLHDFDLSTPKDYTPLLQTVNVRGTSPLQPLRIRFQPRTAAFITLGEPPVGVALVAPVVRRARRATKKKKKKKKTKTKTQRRKTR